MDQCIRTSLNAIYSGDKDVQGKAFQELLSATNAPVDWAYEAWDELVEAPRHKDNRRRAIAAQILCNLAKSDPETRMLSTAPALLELTKDERFVTARHCMQSLWKVGVAGESQRELLVTGLETRFRECAAEKNCTLIRYDIAESLRKIFDRAADEKVRQTALALIEMEADLKYKKKYMTLWRR